MKTKMNLPDPCRIVESFQIVSEKFAQNHRCFGHSASVPFSGKLAAVLASRALGMS